MASGYWYGGQCLPREVVASSLCLDYGSEWGSGNTVYTSSCTAATPSAVLSSSNTFAMAIRRCSGTNSLSCSNQGTITSTAVFCDTDVTTGPFELSRSDAIQLGGLILAVWVAAATFKWLYRALDNSPDRF